MKRKTAILLALVCLLTAVLPGCKSGGGDGPQSSVQEEPPSITVCIDMHVTSGIGELLGKLPGNGTDFKVLPEIVASQGAERETATTRIRTEILAGKGPDVFICECPTLGLWIGDEDAQGLFPLPKQVMENRVFLPLDSYIENAEYMEWDKLLPAVMESGRNEDGQQLIPLAYWIRAALYDKNDYTMPEDFPDTYMGMRQSGDPFIRSAAGGGLANIVGTLADYEKDVPAITEEELLELALEMNTVTPASEIEEMSSLPEHEYVAFDRGNIERSIVRLDDYSPEYVMLPSCNSTGGITAEVTVYAAVNRNTQNPDEAFKVVDFLLSRNNQQSSKFYEESVTGMPVHMDIGGSEARLSAPMTMSEANFQEFQRLRDRITVVNYPGPLDKAMLEITKITPCTEEEMKKKVHEQYMIMCMVLAES